MIQIKDSILDKNVTSDIISYTHTLQRLSTIQDFKIADCFAIAGLSQLSDKVKGLFLRNLASLPIKLELLDQNELTVVNTIREFVNKPPRKRLCGDIAIDQGNTTLELIRLNHPTKYRYEIRLSFPLGIDCFLNHIDVDIRKTIVLPVLLTKRLNYLGMIGNKVVYSNADTLMNKQPTGDFLFQLNFKNIDEESIIQLDKTYSFN